MQESSSDDMKDEDVPADSALILRDYAQELMECAAEGFGKVRMLKPWTTELGSRSSHRQLVTRNRDLVVEKENIGHVINLFKMHANNGKRRNDEEKEDDSAIVKRQRLENKPRQDPEDMYLDGYMADDEDMIDDQQEELSGAVANDLKIGN